MLTRASLIRTLLVLILLSVALPPLIPAQAQAGICDSAPPAQLAIGDWAAVTEIVSSTAAGGLRLRAEPRTTGQEVGLFPAGTVVRVIDGPACNDGFNWWHIALPESGEEGWSAEGFATSYYLLPTSAPLATAAIAVPTTPTPAVATISTVPAGNDVPAGGGQPADGVCAEDPAPGSYLRVGASVRVADQTRPARLYAEPNSDSFINWIVYQDPALTVLDGPRCGEGYTWWLVDNGSASGWTMEAAGGRYRVIDPAFPPPAVDYAGGISPVPPPPTPLPADQPTPVPTPRPVTPPIVGKQAAYSPDGSQFVVGDASGLRIYETAGYSLQSTQPGGVVLDLVPLGGELYAITWAAEGIRLFSVTTGTIRTVLTAAPHDPAWAAASPDGLWLVLGPTSDGAPATLWDLNAAAPPAFAPYWWPADGAAFVVFSPDGRFVLVNDIVYLLSCQTAGTGCQFDLVRDDGLPAGFFGGAGWSADGEWLAGFSDRFWLWNGNTLGVGFTLRSTMQGQDPRRAALSPDGQRGAIASRRLLELWTLEAGNYFSNRVIELPDLVREVLFNGSGTQVAIVAGDSVRVYDAASGAVLFQLE